MTFLCDSNWIAYFRLSTDTVCKSKNCKKIVDKYTVIPT